MRGQILGVDRTSGDAQVTGEDGKRYRFGPTDWADPTGPAVGAMVDFDIAEGRAVSVYRVPGSVPATAATPPAPRRRRGDRNRFIAAILAFFFGVLGLHRFYLGRVGSGIVMLLLTCTLFGVIISGTWAIIDLIRYLMMSEDEFDRRYARD